MKLFILLGAPGSGKGTQSLLLSEKLDVPVMCMGDIVRSEMKNRTALGEKMKSYIQRGDLVPTKLINDIFLDNLNKTNTKKGVILDGFPRTREQAEFLESNVTETITGTYIVNIEVPRPVLVQRLLERRREDDTESVIENRLNTFNSEMAPLIAYYQSRVISINGDNPIDEITDVILNCIN